MILVFLCLISFSGQAQYTSYIDLGKESDTSQLVLTKQKPSILYRYRATSSPSLLIGLGLLTFHDNETVDRYDIHEVRQRFIPRFRVRTDDYLQFAPIALVYGLDKLGVKARNTFTNRSLKLLTAELLSIAVVMPLKEYTDVRRPNGGDSRSFPSGHTTQAFVSATFMHKELGHLSRWYSISAYATATAVGVLRIMNNKHWLSDVLVGAGVGILSTNLAYKIFPTNSSQKKWASNMVITPSYFQGNVGFRMLLTLH